MVRLSNWTALQKSAFKKLSLARLETTAWLFVKKKRAGKMKLVVDGRVCGESPRHHLRWLVSPKLRVRQRVKPKMKLKLRVQLKVTAEQRWSERAN